MRVPAELTSFLHSGLSCIVGTRDQQLRPDVVRACGVVVADDRAALTVYLPVGTADRAAANLRDNGLIAITLSLPTTHRTVQLKGELLELELAREEERSTVEAYMERFVENLAIVGLSRARAGRLNHWPCWAARVRVRDVFDQSLGPLAGKRLDVAEEV